MKTKKLVCLIIGHRFNERLVSSRAEAQHWVCRRCGEKHYKRTLESTYSPLPPGSAGGSGDAG